MRTLFTLILAATLFTSLQAQVVPGDKFLGGRFRLDYGNSNNSVIAIDGSSLTLSISPRMGFLIKENLAVGMAASFAYAKQPDFFFLSNNNPNNPIILGGDEIVQYSIGPFLRHYTSFSESAGLVVDLYTEIGGGTIDQEGVTGVASNASLFNIGAGILPGFYYFFSPRFCLEASFGGLRYNYARTKEKDQTVGNGSNTKISDLQLTLASQLAISFNYYFLKK